MSLKNLKYLGATLAYGPSTSTGNGSVITVPPLSALAMQVVVNGTGTGTVQLQGSLDGTNWTNILAATTYTANRLIRSSTVGAITALRVQCTVNASTKDMSVYLSGR